VNIESELRIGDAEREAAASALGEHFASGRLTREEYDERTDQVWTAKTNSDLRPLFTDLPPPQTAPQSPGKASARGHDDRGPSHHRDSARTWNRLRVPFLPVVLLAIALLIALPGFPWLLFVLGWLWFAGCFGHRGMGRGWAQRS